MSSKTIHLHAYRVNQYEGEIQLTVHDQMEWVPLSKLLDHDQLPADYLISQKLLEVLRCASDRHLQWATQ